MHFANVVIIQQFRYYFYVLKYIGNTVSKMWQYENLELIKRVAISVSNSFFIYFLYCLNYITVIFVYYDR